MNYPPIKETQASPIKATAEVIYHSESSLPPAIKMDEASLKQFYADSPPAVVLLTIKLHWEGLTDKQKLYAHYISR